MIELKVSKRDALGKKTKNLRNQGQVPAELYGREVKNVHLSVPEKEFIKVFEEAGESTVVNLDIDGEKHPVLIHEADYDEMREQYRSIDFYQVNMKEKTTAQVLVELIGEAPAIKEKEGVLVRVIQEVEVEALPADLPHTLQVSIEGLIDIGQSVHIKDIKVPQGVEILEDENQVVATISERQAEEVEPRGPTDVSQVEVEGEKKENKEGEQSATENKK